MVDRQSIQAQGTAQDRGRPHTNRRALVIGALAGGLQLPGLATARGEETHMTQEDEAARRIYEEWHTGFRDRTLDRVVALYAETATIETPAVLSVFPEMDEGILVGRDKIRDLFERGLGALTDAFKYRNGLFFSNGRYLTWEYPRKTPDGAQIDLFESMDIENGLITYHRVYWGWRGLKALIANREKTKAG